MDKQVTVREVIGWYLDGGIGTVMRMLRDNEGRVLTDTWPRYVLDSLDKGLYRSVILEIDMVVLKMQMQNDKLDEREGTGKSRTDGGDITGV